MENLRDKIFNYRGSLSKELSNEINYKFNRFLSVASDVPYHLFDRKIREIIG